MFSRSIVAMGLLLLLWQWPATSRADYATILEVENQACMGDDKSRRQTEQEALNNTKRLAAEHARTWLSSETTVQDMVLEKDLVEAFAQATVKILEELEKVWFTDTRAGDCFRIRVRAEVIPLLDDFSRGADRRAPDPTGPLEVRLWTSQAVYRNNDTMHIYVTGNKPFFARILYQDAAGQILQLLPNAYRTDDYFNGVTVYEIPSGKDQFELKVSPPFGTETIILYASTAPLGQLRLTDLGPVYMVQNATADIPAQTRGVKIQAKSSLGIAAAEFIENRHVVETRP